jgi:hypothetical protein
MNKIIFYIAASVLLSSCTKERVAQDLKNSFINFYGGTSTNEGFDVKQLKDGSYIALGTTATSDSGKQMFLLKVDKYGRKEWQNKFGYEYNDEGLSLQVMTDGYILAGYSDKDNTSSPKSNILLVRTDSKGNLRWKKQIGGDTSQRAYCIQIASQGGFVLAGSRDIGNVKIVMIAFTDTNGNNPKYSDHAANDQITYSGEAKYVIESNDKTYIFTGTTTFNFPDDTTALSNMIVGRVGHDQKLWKGVRNFGGTHDESGECIKQLSDGSFVSVGTIAISTTNNDVYLVKFKLANDGFIRVWENHYDGDQNIDAGKSIEVVTDSLFAIVGTYGSSNAKDIFFLPVDGSGNLIERDDYFFSGVYDQWANCIVKTSDGGFILTGTQEFSLNKSVMSLIKIDKTGGL